MKRLIILSFFSIILTSSYSQTIEFSDFDLGQNLPDWVSFEKVMLKKVLNIDRTLNPFYLEEDFNGDGKLDIAIFVSENETDKKGILIIHGETFESYLLGAGRQFGSGKDNFSWLKVWKPYRKSTAQKTTFNPNGDIDSSIEIKLENIAISVSASESPSNLIVWTGKEYKWIHTGD